MPVVFKALFFSAAHKACKTGKSWRKILRTICWKRKKIFFHSFYVADCLCGFQSLFNGFLVLFFFMPEAKLNVELIAFTPNPDVNCATAAHICYANASISDLRKKVSQEYAQKLLRKLIDSGHHSTLEHAVFSFGVEGISRACSHQLVRHRVASYNQQSQRYVKEGGFNFIVPPKIKANEQACKKFLEAIEYSRSAYDEMLKVAPAEDARFLLPNACETRIVITMNARELRHFFEERCCSKAQWEIREMADKMLSLAKGVAPFLFDGAGPKCLRLGYCPEEKTCGRYPLKKDALKNP
jgi:thymidylate synthase (FAD)